MCVGGLRRKQPTVVLALVPETGASVSLFLQSLRTATRARARRNGWAKRYAYGPDKQGYVLVVSNWKRGSKKSRRARDAYRHPIPEPTRILQELERVGVPLSLESLAGELKVDVSRHETPLRQRLRAMVRAGQLLTNRQGEYCLLKKIDVVTGQVSAHPDGFGFLIAEDGGDDVYLAYAEMRSLLDGDRVAVHVSPGGRPGRRAGTLVEIIERGRESAVGRYERRDGIGYVLEAGRIPHQYLVADRDRAGARHGDLVKIEITQFPTRTTDAQGRVVRVLGDAGDPRMVAEVAIEQFALRSQWPNNVLDAADGLGVKVRPADKSDRIDLRGLPLVTIDGADAKDFDDAVFAEPAGDDWRVLVAIADVSHYVSPGGEIDHEARRRGTSTYFPGRVVPMLPESLSNGLCSLRPKVDRLCMVCDMRVASSGKVIRAKFYRGLMRSAARLTYADVDTLHRTGEGRKAVQDLKTPIANLFGAYACFSRARARRGALDMELPEVGIELDDAGNVARIRPRVRNDAHKLIEEFMVAANVEAAKFLGRKRLATLFRVHAGPGDEKFEELRVQLQHLGIKVPEQARTNPRQLNRVLHAIRKRPDANQLTIAVLRSLSQAVYQPDNIGHFGLALSTYAHFTSPIRRYPDLLVHRGIGHLLDNARPGDFDYSATDMVAEGKRCSEQERKAEEASRFVESRLNAAYLVQHIGESLPGVITGVTHFGLFVTLDELFVDGLIHVTALPKDYYHLQAGGLILEGERSGRSFTLGDRISVRVVRVDTDEAKVDFVIDEPDENDRPRRSSGRKSRRRARG